VNLFVKEKSDQYLSVIIDKIMMGNLVVAKYSSRAPFAESTFKIDLLPQKERIRGVLLLILICRFVIFNCEIANEHSTKDKSVLMVGVLAIQNNRPITNHITNE
jgi:hypothetical protein